MPAIALERDGIPVMTFDHVPSSPAVVSVIAASSSESSADADALTDALRAVAESTSTSHFVQKLFSPAVVFVYVVPILVAIVIIGCLG
jgi:hypothetical protein